VARISEHRPIEQTPVFDCFEQCARAIWSEVQGWRKFSQDTLGKQLVRAIDSVNANLCEGDGRFTAADGLRFFVIARGSAREARLWLVRSQERSLIAPDTSEKLLQQVDSGIAQLNLLINYRRERGSFVKEDLATYFAEEV